MAVEVSDYNLGYDSVAQWREYKLLAGWLIDIVYDNIGLLGCNHFNIVGFSDRNALGS